MTPEETLAAFIDAFNNLETDRFLTFFDSRAVSFHPMAAYPARLEGEALFESWRAIHASFRDDRPGPPYLAITPLDLQVQRFGEIAIASFHLRTPGVPPGRRTIVLLESGNEWKIVHMHASSMPS